MSSKVYRRTGSVNPPKTAFNLSHDVKLNCDMGQLIPILCEEMVPGDVFKMAAEIVARVQPLVAPILHEVNLYLHSFFVPNRMMWDEWEDFITGGVDGTLEPTLPRWTPTNNAKYSLWDYIGFPLSINPAGALPCDFPRIAYNMIWNEYFRDQNLQAEVLLTNENILTRCWEKDYFTSALPWQQRGIAPALPVNITGMSHAIFPGAITPPSTQVVWPAVGAANSTIMYHNSSTHAPFDTGTKQALEANTAHTHVIPKATLDNNNVDLSVATATTFNVSDLRLAFQIQRWMERNARSGARYIEFLMAHYGVSPRDERLQRPEYIGGCKVPLIVSEVLQTSETATSPQGNLAGHGIAVGTNMIGTYHAEEFGWVMTILSIMPKPAYSQGIDRQFLRETKYDFYSPEFANLSEQAITRAELYASNVLAENQTVFGFQGRFDEMRIKRSKIVADMRDVFDYWHLARQFSSPPLLNSTFVQCVPRKDIFAVQDEPGFILNVANLIKAYRPMPLMSNPGLIDH